MLLLHNPQIGLRLSTVSGPPSALARTCPHSNSNAVIIVELQHQQYPVPRVAPMNLFQTSWRIAFFIVLDTVFDEGVGEDIVGFYTLIEHACVRGARVVTSCPGSSTG